MDILTHVTDIIQEVFENTMETASLACDFVQRKRILTAYAFAKILFFGWLENPDASYTDFAHTARALDIEVSHQAIEKPMTFKAVETLKATIEVAASQVVYTPHTHFHSSISLQVCLCRTVNPIHSRIK